MDSNLLIALASSLFTAVIGPIAVSIVNRKLEIKHKENALKDSLKKKIGRAHV